MSVPLARARPLRPVSGTLVDSTIPPTPRRRYVPGKGEAYDAGYPPNEVCGPIFGGAGEVSRTAYVTGQPT